MRDSEIETMTEKEREMHNYELLKLSKINSADCGLLDVPKQGWA